MHTFSLLWLSYDSFVQNKNQFNRTKKINGRQPAFDLRPLTLVDKAKTKKVEDIYHRIRQFMV